MVTSKRAGLDVSVMADIAASMIAEGSNFCFFGLLVDDDMVVVVFDMMTAFVVYGTEAG